MKTEEKNNICLTVKDFFVSKDEVLFVYLFGSFVNRDIFRDIDIAVYMRTTPDLVGRGKLQVALDSLLRYTVDVTILNELPNKNPAFAYEIVTKGTLLLNKKPDIHTSYKSRVFQHYFDTAYLRKQFKEAFAHRISSDNFGERNYD